MIVAVTVMRMVQVVADEIVDMVAVRDCLVAAVRTMLVSGVVFGAGMTAGALIRIHFGNLHRMLIVVVTVRAVHVPFVQVVDMVAMLDRCMSATRPVPMVGVFVGFVFVAHGPSPFNRCAG